MRRQKALLSILLVPAVLVGALLFLFSTGRGHASAATAKNNSGSRPLESAARVAAPEIYASTVVTGADLEIRKFSAPTNEVQAGEQFTYTIIVDNWGPITATNIVITDTLVTSGFVDANGCSIAVRTDGGAVDEFVCNFALSTGVFDLGTFGSNHLNPRSPTDMGRIIITINATATDATDMTNLATVTSETYDPDTSNNSVVTTLSVLDTSDLEIAASSTVDPVSAGEYITYTARVTNTGPSTAGNTMVVGHLPADLEAVSATASSGSCAVGTPGDPNAPLTCSFGNVPAGGSRTVTVQALVKPTMDTALTADFSTFSESIEPNLSDNFASVLTTVENGGIADLQIWKFASPTNEVRAGEQFTYTIIVDNWGPWRAENIVITDTLVTSGFVDANGCSIAVRTDGGTVDEFDCNFALSTGVFDLGTFGANWLNPRSPTDMGRIIITINGTANDATDMTNLATVTSDTYDPDTSNNSVATTLSVTAVSDLAVEKSVDPVVIIPGLPVTYTLVVTNNGPSTAENVVVYDWLPHETTLTGTWVSTSGSCVGGSPLQCNLGNMASGAIATVEVYVLPDSDLDGEALIQNDALVSSDTLDPDTSDNGDSVISDVALVADLEISKTQTPETVFNGGQIEYTIVVTNNGPADVFGATVEDLLPAELSGATWVCASYSGTCTGAGSGDIDEWVDLPKGESLIFSVFATVDGGQVFTNTATVAAPTGVTDPIPGNNTASVASMSPAVFDNTIWLPMVIRSGGRVFHPDLVITSLSVSANAVEVTIENIGLADVVSSFWVDVYIDPYAAPEEPGQVWQMLGFEGLAWGVGEAALPMSPGESLVLTVGDLYYDPNNSSVLWPIESGQVVYAQVDSYGGGTGYGAVLEEHEVTGLPYNNIVGPLNPTGGEALDGAPDILDLERDFTGLPVRPK